MNHPRVAHLDFISDPGVNRKLREQADAARGLGLPIDFFAISHLHHDHDEGALRFRRSRRSDAPLRNVPRLLYSLFAEREDLVAPYIDPKDYDLFIIRFGKVFLAQGITYRRYSRRIVTEHHTDEIAELLLKPGLGRRFLASVTLRRSGRALARVGAIVAMTGELAELEARKSGRIDVPRFIFSNGADVPTAKPPGRMYRQGGPLQIAFAASDYSPWQGLDRLLAGLAAYTGSAPLVLRIAGLLDRDQADAVRRAEQRANVRIQPVGLLDRAGIADLFAWAHVGVAALSMFRNRIREACPLKVREYAAHGLPFVYAFIDPDIPGDWPFALRLPADDSLIDVGRIARFAEDLYARGDPGPSIHSYALAHLDWKAKLVRLYDFLCTLPSVEAGPS